MRASDVLWEMGDKFRRRASDVTFTSRQRHAETACDPSKNDVGQPFVRGIQNHIQESNDSCEGGPNATDGTADYEARPPNDEGNDSVPLNAFSVPRPRLIAAHANALVWAVYVVRQRSPRKYRP